MKGTDRSRGATTNDPRFKRFYHEKDMKDAPQQRCNNKRSKISKILHVKDMKDTGRSRGATTKDPHEKDTV